MEKTFFKAPYVCLTAIETIILKGNMGIKSIRHKTALSTVSVTKLIKSDVLTGLSTVSLNF